MGIGTFAGRLDPGALNEAEEIFFSGTTTKLLPSPAGGRPDSEGGSRTAHAEALRTDGGLITSPGTRWRSFSVGLFAGIGRKIFREVTLSRERPEDLLDTWRTRYPDKFAPEEKVFAHIRRGSRIFISTGCGEPAASGPHPAIDYVESIPRPFV